MLGHLGAEKRLEASTIYYDTGREGSSGRSYLLYTEGVSRRGEVSHLVRKGGVGRRGGITHLVRKGGGRPPRGGHPLNTWDRRPPRVVAC